MWGVCTAALDALELSLEEVVRNPMRMLSIKPEPSAITAPVSSSPEHMLIATRQLGLANVGFYIFIL